MKIMDIVLKRSELGILAFGMNITRKAIKKGFKANYGVFEGKKKIKTFDDIKERLLNMAKEEKESYEVEFLSDELIMLYSFLGWYIAELQKEVKSETNEEQLTILNDIYQKIVALDNEGAAS